MVLWSVNRLATPSKKVYVSTRQRPILILRLRLRMNNFILVHTVDIKEHCQYWMKIIYKTTLKMPKNKPSQEELSLEV